MKRFIPFVLLLSLVLSISACAAPIKDTSVTLLTTPEPKPPEIFLYSHEGEKIQPMRVGYFWIQVVDGQEIGTVSESPDILQPGVVDEQIDTQYGYLILDVTELMPINVDAECWSISTLGTEYHPGMDSLNVGVTFGEGSGQLIPGNSFTSNNKLYQLDLKSGENIYQIIIQWPKGMAWYSFRANYKE